MSMVPRTSHHIPVTSAVTTVCWIRSCFADGKPRPTVAASKYWGRLSSAQSAYLVKPRLLLAFLGPEHDWLRGHGQGPLGIGEQPPNAVLACQGLPLTGAGEAPQLGLLPLHRLACARRVPERHWLLMLRLKVERRAAPEWLRGRFDVGAVAGRVPEDLDEVRVRGRDRRDGPRDVLHPDEDQ